MKIVVCIKQVPATSVVKMNAETGSLNRSGAASKTNPYDLFALETALRIREALGGTVTALTMGPAQAEVMMHDALMCGADDAVILTDRKFAGSDVLATSYALSQAIRTLGGADLIICGKQTTDGDTAQIGPAIAEHLGLPHAAWVQEIDTSTMGKIMVSQNLGSMTQRLGLSYPCLVTVDKDIFVPRLPSYLRKDEAQKKEIRRLSFADLEDQDEVHYGRNGSPTRVEKVFPPDDTSEKIWISGDAQTQAEALANVFFTRKFL